ncbi:MAG: succinate dehydrogenase iron-sulfur subunit [Candidatus Krumholzibacteria bacterium]|jgi:succinate dehydrogenase / fumarate reductase iron-sulfur subunit|nr:succinate dehydrogenase iron-sulfur subunit [Candidatus Krumholzibacteria bacterium]
MAIITFKINRFNPDDERRGHFMQEYQVEAKKGDTILDCLNRIKWKQDGSLTFRRSCRSGICGSCAMTINGVNNLACEVQVLALKSDTITVEPLRGYPVIKDLVVSLDLMVNGLLKVKPYMITKTPPPTDQERLQSPEEREKLDGLYECILCGSCTSSCPSFWADKEYIGPHAFLKAYRFVADTRDEAPREHLGPLDDKHGLWRCHTIFNCVEACPKDLNPTKAISELKKALVNDKF